MRRANSLKRLGSTLGTLSSDSNESVHNQAEVASQHASTIGSSAGNFFINFFFYFFFYFFFASIQVFHSLVSFFHAAHIF